MVKTEVAADAIRVVIADDAPDIRLLLRLRLQHEGFTVVGEAVDGAEAVEVVGRHLPDVVILDVAMPRMDGFEAAERIKSLPSPPRVLMYSAFEREEMVQRADAVGADGFLEKSAPEKELISRLRALAPGPRPPRRTRGDHSPVELATSAARAEPHDPEEERLRTLLDALAEAVVIVDDRGTVELANYAAARLFGLRTSEVVGRTWAELPFARLLEDGTEIERPSDFLLHRVLETARPASAVPQGVRRPDGTVRWTLVSARPLRKTGDEQPYAVVASFTDVTEQRIATEVSRMRERQLRTSLETMLDPFVILSSVRDDDGRIVDFVYDFANHAAHEANEVEPGSLVGRRLLELLPEHTDAGLFDAYCRIIEQQEPLVLDEFAYEDVWGGQRQRRVFDVRAHAMGDALAYTWRDVTDRVRRRHEEVADARWLEQATAAVLDGFAIFSAVRDDSGRVVDLRFEYINERGAALNERPVEDHRGRTLLELLPEHGPSGLLDRYARVVETGEPIEIESLDYEDVYGSGRRLARAFEVRATRYGDGVAVAWRDITGRKRGEQALAVANEALRERTAQLLEANEHLRRMNDDLERFAGIVSHDVRAPLSVISAALETLVEDVGPLLSDEDRELISVARRGSQRADRLTRDLLEWSRIGTGELHPERCDVTALAHEILEELQAKVTSTGAVVRTGTLGELRADRQTVALTIRNLIANALAYRRPDVVPEVELAAVDEGDAWHLTVADNGPGIPAPDRERVFEPFVRLSAGHEPGTGIGLAIVRRAVERQGGRVWVEPATPGPGSVFHVTLPSC